LISPVEHCSLKVEQIKGTQFEVGYQRSRISLCWDEHNQWTFVAGEALAIKTLKIAARHQRHSIDAKIFGNLAKG
jgi:hypothetical protein